MARCHKPDTSTLIPSDSNEINPHCVCVCARLFVRICCVTFWELSTAKRGTQFWHISLTSSNQGALTPPPTPPQSFLPIFFLPSLTLPVFLSPLPLFFSFLFSRVRRSEKLNQENRHITHTHTKNLQKCLTCSKLSSNNRVLWSHSSRRCSAESTAEKMKVVL